MSLPIDFRDAAQAQELIDAIAATERLFVISDFDGTVAHFSTDIYGVPVNQDSLDALSAFAQLPNTFAAALSGRHLDGLKRVFPLRDPVMLGGSHGAETEGEESSLTEDMKSFLDRVDAELNAIAADYEGAFVEQKPFHRGLHVKAVSERDPQAAAEALARGLEVDPGDYFVAEGKNLVEFSATTANKGTWIKTQRANVDATAVVFLGDDTTDEDGFKVLNQPTDLGVKVGDGDTAAYLRVTDIDEVAEFLASLLRARQAFLAN
ncbi:trehalose-phosphatase [Corynebacterium sp. L4756]|uniref:trehalose-phosphatase n=1 Tax=unclassified Corynebacterium TaxID=2624378 RepID=UPI00374D6505